MRGVYRLFGDLGCCWFQLRLGLFNHKEVVVCSVGEIFIWVVRRFASAFSWQVRSIDLWPVCLQLTQ